MSVAEPIPVTVLSAGGTIAMAGVGGGRGVSPELDGDALVAAVPGLGAVAGLRVRSLLNCPSAQLTGAQALGIAQAAVEEAGRGRGVVVTHGTDTLEEVAYLADLLYGGATPVVFTGAMRPATAAGADGPANLLDATAVAAASAACDLGVVVVFGGEVHAARAVRKADSTSRSAFQSPRLGPLGRIEEGRVRVEGSVARLPPIAATRLDARVPIVPAALGDDGLFVDAALDAGADGIVAVALGAGHVPPPFLAALRRAAARVPVVATVRPKRGAILHDTYAFEGSERDLRDGGMVAAGALTSAAARIKLLACLGAGYDRDQIAAAFAPDDQ
ncbi:MAG TPA: asparaginase domain-containing protein [Solirubrobacteraceae bacterium]